MAFEWHSSFFALQLCWKAKKLECSLCGSVCDVPGDGCTAPCVVNARGDHFSVKQYSAPPWAILFQQGHCRAGRAHCSQTQR